MAKIDDIKTLINKRGGFAKPNRFAVDFSGLASKISGFDTDQFRDLNILVDSLSIPGRTISTTDFGAWRHTIKVPTAYTEDDIEMVFNVTNDFTSKKILDAWLNLVISEESYLVAYDSEYKIDIKISQLDDNDNETYSANIYGAFPISVKGLPLDNNSESAVSRCNATFAYDYFKINK